MTTNGAAGGGNGAAAAPTFPGADRVSADPASRGIDPAALARATRTIFGIDKRYGFLVARDGVIVHEHYLRDAAATNPIYSLTKGFGATLFGIAERQGLLSVQDNVNDWLPVHHPEIVADATIEHVLNMTAGRSPAGTWWQYNSNEILNSLPGILWHASGQTPHAFYAEHLREPLGLSFDWPHNDKGWIQIGSQGPLPVIQATHRDIARLGLLWMNHGNWNGQQILSRAFVAAALRPPYPDANGAYGYLWWLNSGSGTWRTTGGRSGSGRWFPDAPESMFLGLGARGKVLVVLPEQGLIAVTMGDTAQEQSADYLQTIVGAVLDLLG